MPLKWSPILLLAVILLEGCVAPGSTIGYLSIKGQVKTTQDKPVEGQTISFFLSKNYGLSEFDLAVFNPEVFGNKDKVFSAVTDTNGNFNYDLGVQVHHVSCWIFPPVGCFPKHPPAPVIFLKLMDISNEYYEVSTHDGKYRIFLSDGSELAISAAQLSGLSVINNHHRRREYRETTTEINITIDPD